MIKMRPRSSWAGTDHPPVRTLTESIVADHVEVHHSVTPMPNTSQAAAVIRGIYDFHVGPQRGWSDIFYNYLVDSEGGIWIGRDAKYRSDKNTPAITVCVLGNLAEDEVPDAVKHAILDINAHYGFTKPLSWHAKRAFGTKFASSCPGGNMIEWLKAGNPRPSTGMSANMTKTEATGHVNWCYENILGRPADPSGLSYWVDRLVNGLAVDDMRWQFVAVRFAMDQGPQTVGARDKFITDLIELAKAS
jgi:Domain of unknown function (DUF4214)